MKLRGIRTARVVTLRPAMEVQVVRVAQADINTRWGIYEQLALSMEPHKGNGSKGTEQRAEKKIESATTERTLN